MYIILYQNNVVYIKKKNQGGGGVVQENIGQNVGLTFFLCSLFLPVLYVYTFCGY